MLFQCCGGESWSLHQCGYSHHPWFFLLFILMLARTLSEHMMILLSTSNESFWVLPVHRIPFLFVVERSQWKKSTQHIKYIGGSSDMLSSLCPTSSSAEPRCRRFWSHHLFPESKPHCCMKITSILVSNLSSLISCLVCSLSSHTGKIIPSLFYSIYGSVSVFTILKSACSFRADGPSPRYISYLLQELDEAWGFRFFSFHID